MNGTWSKKPRERAGKQARAERRSREASKYAVVERLLDEATDPLLQEALIDWMARTIGIRIGRNLTFIYPGQPGPSQAHCHKAQWLMEHRKYDEPQCLFFPHMRPGVPVTVKFNFQRVAAAKAMLIMTRGPVAGLQATHRCGNGHLSCVNRRHLEWATSGDNQRDMALHNSPVIMRGHLSPHDEDEIAEANEMEAVLAHRFKTTIVTVREIRSSPFR